VPSKFTLKCDSSDSIALKWEEFCLFQGLTVALGRAYAHLVWYGAAGSQPNDGQLYFRLLAGPELETRTC